MVELGASLDSVLGNELLSNFSAKGMVEEAEDVFEQMASGGVKVDIRDFNNMLEKVEAKKVRRGREKGEGEEGWMLDIDFFFFFLGENVYQKIDASACAA